MYRYRCGQCATTSPSVRTRVEMRHERDVHRHRAHGGHIPDGERMQRAVRSSGDNRVALFCLALLAVLLLASGIARQIG